MVESDKSFGEDDGCDSDVWQGGIRGPFRDPISTAESRAFNEELSRKYGIADEWTAIIEGSELSVLLHDYNIGTQMDPEKRDQVYQILAELGIDVFPGLEQTFYRQNMGNYDENGIFRGVFFIPLSEIACNKGSLFFSCMFDEKGHYVLIMENDESNELPIWDGGAPKDEEV